MARNASGGGVGFVGLLTVVFVVLRLTGFIDWAWWWLASPLWIGAALALGAIGAIAVVAFISIVIEDAMARRRRKKEA